MRFALINGERMEAKFGLTATCPGCSRIVIAKCGTQRIHHWAHKSNKTCDSWWELETDWHRTWKNHFPVEWQEAFLLDEQTGEKHIADIRSNSGFVIEFQYSAIKPEERISREKFYQNMVWLVNGTRLKRDWLRFQKGLEEALTTTTTQGFFLAHWPDECFPKTWLECSVPVIFDFLGNVALDDSQDRLKEVLWCLLPGCAEGQAVVVCIKREDFINRVLEYSQLFTDQPHELVQAFASNIRQQNQIRGRQNIETFLRQAPTRHSRRRWRF